MRIPLTVLLWLALSHGTDQPKSEQFIDICSFAQSQWSFRSDAREHSKQTNTAFHRSAKDRQLTKNLAQKRVTKIWWGQGLNLKPPGWEAGILPLRQQTSHSLHDSSPLFHNQSVQCLHTLTPEKENYRNIRLVAFQARVINSLISNMPMLSELIALK